MKTIQSKGALTIYQIPSSQHQQCGADSQGIYHPR